MTPRTLGLALGLLYLGLGVLGMMPGVLAGLFPANLGLTLMHLAMGLWGLAAFTGRAEPRAYARGAAFVFAALALVGMVHGLDRLVMPLYGLNIWLHLLTATVAGFVAWRPQTGERRGLSGDRRRTSAAPVAIERRRHGTYERRKAPAAA
jgi:hypothetical protein